MEINQLIEQLIHSGVIENQELGVNLLKSPEVSLEEKTKYIDEFIEDYTHGKINFFNEEHRTLFKSWVELYSITIKEQK